MIVGNIIANKQIREVLSVKPGDTVETAAKLLAKHRIGAVIVSGDGATVDGILSERDIVRALGTVGASCLESKISDLMTSTVIGCSPKDTALSVIEKMSDGRFRHMPVIENNRIIAVISIGDVVKARITEIQQENSALTGMIANSW